ncbi:hypothetical protein [Desulfovibrio sp. ZJ369]|uniref:hypothetical protein n=1 Tax=Desulfovibrio sp. ZJ369 TaxID=2709793 RepID=UPI0013ECE961|nr:hypothetical protein [Desulfovibrio sp. ZJ369]
MRIFFFVAFLLSLCQSAPVKAADSRSLPSGPYAGLPAAPLASRPVVPQTPATYAPLPPRLPAFLPSGGANLDQAWIQDGGARLYWNTLVIPRQLRMGGASFVDPASVPQLLPPGSVKAVQPVPVRRRRPVSRPKVSRSTQTVAAPANAGRTSLTPPRAELPATAKKATEATAPRGTPAAPRSTSAASSASAGTAAPYTGAAPATAPPVPLPIMPVAPVPPRAPGASR